jgi:hypothetical protein
MDKDNDFPYYEDLGYYEGPSNFGNIVLFVLIIIVLALTFSNIFE